MNTFTRPVPLSKNLAGYTARVTGASGGCGHAIAHYLGSSAIATLLTWIGGAGSDVCVHYNSIDPAPLVKELSVYSVSVRSIQADLSSATEVQRLASETSKWSLTGGIDILVSNAGAGKHKDWMDVVPDS